MSISDEDALGTNERTDDERRPCSPERATPDHEPTGEPASATPRGPLRARVAEIDSRLSRLRSAHDLTSGLLTGAGQRIVALEELLDRAVTLLEAGSDRAARRKWAQQLLADKAALTVARTEPGRVSAGE